MDNVGYMRYISLFVYIISYNYCVTDIQKYSFFLFHIYLIFLFFIMLIYLNLHVCMFACLHVLYIKLFKLISY